MTDMDLRKSITYGDSISINACLDLAFATLIWVYTGDRTIQFLSCKSSRQSPRYSIQELTISPTTTILEAFASITTSDSIESSLVTAAPSALVHVSANATHVLDGQLDDVPLQIRCQTDAADSSVKVQLVFDENIIDRFHGLKVGEHFSRLVTSIWQANLNDLLVQLGQLSAADSSFIKSLNSTPQQLDNRTIHECIAQSLHRNPETTAIEAWDGVLSRKQLDVHSGLLAETLRIAGVKRGCVVGIFMDKSLWVPVTLLAILKAGGAFLIMEPTLPFERLKIMTDRTKVSHAVTSRQHMSLGCSLVPVVVSGDASGEFVVVDQGRESSMPNDPDRPEKVLPEDPAFLIFTSGSSGIPKAIVTQHFAWVTGYTEHIHKFGITQHTRVFQYASYSFVVSILDTISTLMVGGVVCIPSLDERANDLENAIRRMAAEYICMTPSVAKLLTPSRVPSLKTLILVGEPIPRSLAKTWLEASSVTVRNGYGQSEACSMNSTAILTQADKSFRNIGNSTWLRYWVVDPHNHDRLMPIGGLGELIVEGHSVAQGHFGEPEKTQAAFIQSPAWAAEYDAGEDGRRWYKTGDLVQYQENGDLFLYGRKDAQLKVHGQRVEAAEIEHHVMKALQGEISQVVVDKLVDDEVSGAESIVAFVTPSAAADTSDNERTDQTLHKEMFRRLQSSVPLWMIPKGVISISAMPRTATGKLDRRSVKNCIPGPVDSKLSHVAVDSATQSPSDLTWPSKIAESNFNILQPIWSKILKTDMEKVDIGSSWIDAGGDSLSAMMFVREVKSAGYQLSSAELMSNTSLFDLCKTLQLQENTVTHVECTIDDLDQGLDGHSPVTDFQHFYLSRSLHKGQDQLYKYNIAFRGEFDLARLQRALCQWLQGIEALRLSFSRTGGQHLTQSVTAQNKICEYALRRHQGDVDAITAMSASHDFIAHPVLVALTQPSVSENVPIDLVIHIHHGIFDGVSWNLLLDDLVSAYQSGSLRTRPSFLSYLRNRLIQRPPESVDYWRDLLQDSSPTTLRMDPKSSFCDAECASNPEHVISRAVYLEQDSQRKSVATMSTLVQTAWSIVLSAMSGRDDVLFLYLVHGRDENVAASDQIIGCCVAECPLRVQLDKNMSIADLQGLVQKQAMSSTPHAHLGSKTIGSRCTDWSSKEELYHHSSFVLHQTVVAKDHIAVGDTGYIDVGEPEVEHKLTYDFDLASSSSGPGELCFKLRCLCEVYTAQEANATANAFSLALRMLVAGNGKVGELQQRVASIQSLPSVKAEQNTTVTAR